MQQEIPPGTARRWTGPALSAVLPGALIAHRAPEGGRQLSLDPVKSSRDMPLHYLHEHYACTVPASMLIHTGASTPGILPGTFGLPIPARLPGRDAGHCQRHFSRGCAPGRRSPCDL